MPAAPTLSTTIAANDVGHIAASNTVHGIIDNIYLATIDPTPKTTAYTLLQADSGEFVPINVSSSVAITVPIFTVGTSIELYQMGTAGFTLTASGVTFECPGTPTPRARYSTISLLWRTTTIVVVGGDYT